MKEEFLEKLSQAKEMLKDEYEWYTTNISTDGMAISLEMSAFMYAFCNEYKFETLMDRGSGFSSYVLRLYAKIQDFPVEVYSVDNHEGWLEKTKLFLERNNVSTDNLYMWDDFKGFNIKFDFILEDAKKKLRVETPKQLVNFAKNNGVILWDDAKVHSGLIDNMRKKKKMDFYDTKKYTIDKYNRYGVLTSRRKLNV